MKWLIRFHFIIALVFMPIGLLISDFFSKDYLIGITTFLMGWLSFTQVEIYHLEKKLDDLSSRH